MDQNIFTKVYAHKYMYTHKHTRPFEDRTGTDW